MAGCRRARGGSSLKILESIADGLPVVSTRVGAEGLCLTPGDGLRAPSRLHATAARGRALVLRRYDWDVLADDLERSWERCVARRPADALAF